MSKTLVQATSRFLAKRTRRRGFLAKSALVGSAIAVAPRKYFLEPGSAYAAVICNGYNCQPGNLCCDGYTEFCCTLYGTNGCPPGSLYGGWWKVSGSSYCGGNNRYYMDCHSQCGGCTCGGSGVCSGSCNGTVCGCGAGSCFNRKAGCTHFRYGQCNGQIPCVGPIICRVVTCTPPWQLEPTCTTAVRFDEATRFHNRACLQNTSNDSDLPHGSVDIIEAGPDGFRIAGWALDPNITGPIEVAVYVDGTWAAQSFASTPRFDVGQAYLAHGENHGFDMYVNAAVGTRRVCVYAINAGEGTRNPIIDCADVVIDPLNATTGVLESVRADGSQVRVSGYALDPASTEPVAVEILVDDQPAATLTAGVERPELAASHPAAGTAHGFDAVLDVGDGQHTVCAIARDAGGNAVVLGCQVVALGSTATPAGGITDMTATAGQVSLRGWAQIPGSSEPVTVVITVDGEPALEALADTTIGLPSTLSSTTDHGFDASIEVGPGDHRVCLYGVGVDGTRTLLGCGDVTGR